MSDRPDKNNLPIGRCNPCECAKVVYGSGGWAFLGCYCKPYSGKWVSEIEKCPKEENAEND